MTLLRTSLVLCLGSAVLFSPTPGAAQDVQYETVTRIDLPGALGTAVRVAARLGGGSTSTVETTYIKGRKMRTDVDKTSTIFDLDARRFIHLDHGAKTYHAMTFDEMVTRARAAAQEAGAGAGQQRPTGPADAEAHVSFRFAVDEGGQRDRVAGYEADRFFLTMEAEGEYVTTESGAREKGGTLVVFTDMWSSRDAPAFAALNAFQDASAREYANASAALMEGLAAVFADDPRLRVGFEQSIDRIRKMEGMPMKTTTSFIVVAPEQAFDRQLALGERRGPGAAQQAGRAALRGLAARAAGAAARQQEPASGGAAEQTQATILKITSEVRNLRAEPLDAALFGIPAGYREAAPGGYE